MNLQVIKQEFGEEKGGITKFVSDLKKMMTLLKLYYNTVINQLGRPNPILPKKRFALLFTFSLKLEMHILKFELVS